MPRITVAYDPDPTDWGCKLKDKDAKETHFGPGDMLDKVRAGDLLDVERTLRPENPKFPGQSWKITKWKIAGTPTVNHPDQKQLPIRDAVRHFEEVPRPPSYRQQTHPIDQKQMWVNGLGQQWMAAYAQLLSVTTDGKMKPVDPDVVEQAMRAIMTVGDRMFGPTMTQSATKMTKAASEEDMNDEIGF